jgi:hypothetical protein
MNARRPQTVLTTGFALALLLGASLIAGCDRPKATDSAGAPAAAPATAATAEPENATSRDFGNYVVHFTAIKTSDLSPEVARTYNIVRSPNRAMLNVSIVKKVEGTPGQSVVAEVSADAVNLNGQFKNLTLREIREGEAIYYIGDVAVADDETLVFSVGAKPEGEASAYAVKFTQQFVAG